MQISGNAFQSGLEGLKAGQQQVDQAAARIAQATLPAPVVEPLQDVNATAPGLIDLSEQQVLMKVGQYQAEAAGNLVKTADEVLGTLIDTRA